MDKEKGRNTGYIQGIVNIGVLKRLGRFYLDYRINWDKYTVAQPGLVQNKS